MYVQSQFRGTPHTREDCRAHIWSTSTLLGPQALTMTSGLPVPLPVDSVRLPRSNSKMAHVYHERSASMNKPSKLTSGLRT